MQNQIQSSFPSVESHALRCACAFIVCSGSFTKALLLLRNRNLLLFSKSNKKSLLPLYTTTLVWVEWSCDADSWLQPDVLAPGISQTCPIFLPSQLAEASSLEQLKLKKIYIFKNHLCD